MTKTFILLAAIGSIQFSQAAITVNFESGVNRDIFGDPVAEGSLWILVASDDDTFAGGLSEDSSIAGIGSSNSDFFTGQTLSVGDTVGSGGDIVFAIGSFDDEAFAAPALPALEGNGVIAGNSFAFYFFADVAYSGPGNSTSTTGEGTAVLGSQIGGLNTTNVETNFLFAFTFGADGSGGSYGANSADIGGSTPDLAFTSVQLIPEPSSAVFSLLGLSLLLRRKR